MRMIGAYTGSIVGSATNRNRHHMYAGFLGKQPDFVMDFANDADFTAAGDASIPQGWRKFNQKRLMLTMPLVPDLVTPGGVAATLAAAANGDYNTHYQNLMQKYQDAGYQDIIVRLGHEFNGTWFNWRADNGSEDEFVAAFRNAVNSIRNSPNSGGSGVQFRFDWCPTWAAVTPPSNADVEACWPGDDVVDVVGLDVYNQHFPAIADPAARWQAILTGVNGLQWHAAFAATHGKPISFPEWGTGVRFPTDPDNNGAGDDPVFVRNMAAWIEAHPVLYHAYWDFQADLDTRLSDYVFPKATQAYRAAFRPL